MTDSAGSKPCEIITSIAPLAGSSSAWFVDIWGVMHNGVAPFASAVRACQTFRANGGVVLLVSNAPRPSTSVTAALARIGVAADSYDAIITSGDTALLMIAALGAAPIYHLGPDRDLGLYEELAVQLTTLEAATAIICTGLVDDETETADTYRALLERALASALPMICANPDLMVERGGKIIPCAGAVAALYASIGGNVTYAGKPHRPIYDAAFAVIERLAGKSITPDRVIAIGDGIKTDIAGAADAGVRSVYIASGIHVGAAGLDAATLANLFPDARTRPVAAMAQLAW
jgi:HAD superfamily hydrolase (TIGR01459 family)